MAIEGETIEDKCRTFAYMLGLEEPVSAEVLQAAIDNPGYARSLMSAIDNPARLADLLIHPPIIVSSQPANSFSNARLIAKASSALLKWAVAGFPTVPKSTLQKREDACLACPNLKAPETRLQSMSASASTSSKIGNRTGNKSCAVCGCVITNKIRLSTETCPVASSENPALNLWGEAMKTEVAEA